MRLFIAVPIDDINKEIIYKSINNKINLYKAKWVEKENLHITLKFLGEVNQNKIKLINEKLNTLANYTKINSFFFTNLGGFPSDVYMRILFFNIKNKEMLYALSEKINKELEEFGFSATDKFIPHLTIARFKNPVRSPKFDFNNNLNLYQSFTRFLLMESKLKANGPDYSIISEYLLKGE